MIAETDYAKATAAHARRYREQFAIAALTGDQRTRVYGSLTLITEHVAGHVDSYDITWPDIVDEAARILRGGAP